MTIKINIGLEEYLDFQRMQFQVNKQVKKVVNRTKFLMPLFCFIIFMFEALKDGALIWVSFFSFLLLASLWVWLIPKYLLWSSLRRSKKLFLDPINAHMFGEIEVQFCKDDIKLKAHNDESTVKWQNLIGFKESGKNIFLFITILQGIMIPKNQITSLELTQIRELLASKINHSL